MDKKRIFGLMLALSLLAGAFTLGLPQPAQACPANETVYTYYSDASLTTAVGHRIILCNCLGTASSGTRTRYFTVDSLPCEY